MMLAPTLEIVLQLESAPQLRMVCANESEQERLLDWIYTNAELRELVRQALDLAQQQPAA